MLDQNSQGKYPKNSVLKTKSAFANEALLNDDADICVTEEDLMSQESIAKN